MTPLVVFDTNILLSGLSYRGAPYACLELARRSVITSITCQEILDEMARVLATKFRFSANDVTSAVADSISFSQVVRITNTLQAIEADPADNKIIECAVCGSANYIVSGDRRHVLPLGSFQGILILDASTMLAQFPTTP